MSLHFLADDFLFMTKTPFGTTHEIGVTAAVIFAGFLATTAATAAWLLPARGKQKAKWRWDYKNVLIEPLLAPSSLSLAAAFLEGYRSSRNSQMKEPTLEVIHFSGKRVPLSPLRVWPGRGRHSRTAEAATRKPPSSKE